MFILQPKFESSLWPRLAAPLVVGALFTLSHQADAQAAASPAYVVTDQEGYGVFECLKEKSDCGKVVADAWCESHGHGQARAYGRAEDMTASTASDAPRPVVEAGATIVSCEP